MLKPHYCILLGDRLLNRRHFMLFVALMLAALVSLPVSSQTPVGPETYPPGINPLTGLPVADPFTLDRRPIIVKISNYPPFVRPQPGLMAADVVWEHLLAGGVTRFSAVFLSNDVDVAGPIRSLRLVDFELVRIYRALSVFSGMAQGTLDVLRTDALMSSRVVGGVDPCPALCRQERPGVALEHTLFGNTAALRELAAERGRDVEPEAVYGMAFSEAPAREGTPLDALRIYWAETTVEWAYDAETGLWLRSQDGEPHFTEEGTRVSAANVVVVEEEHTVQANVAPNYWGPGDFAFSVNFIGDGRMYFLRDGQYFTGEWRRETRQDPLTFFDENGDLLTFKPGNSFFGLVPRWVDGYQLEFAVPNPPIATVAGTVGQPMRLGPGDGYVTPDVAYPGDSFELIGRNNASTWLQLRTSYGALVWLPRTVLAFDEAALANLPKTRPTVER